MRTPEVVGLDGHDGSGKSTLCRALADATDGVVVRPFAGENGKALMDASDRGDLPAVSQIGKGAIGHALAERQADQTLILDRSWLTVASLLPREVFAESWDLWVPTLLCWADLPTTLSRVGARDERQESEEWHRGYLKEYQELAEAFDVPVIRTDQLSPTESLDRALVHFGWSA